MPVIYAFCSAIAAALVAIFAKMGLSNLDSTLATTVRSIIMAIFLVLVSLVFGKFKGFSLNSLNSREWLLIVLAGIAGATSWLFYFLAIQGGKTSSIVAIDKLSVVIVLVLAWIVLGEVFSIKSLLGGIFMVIGAILISLA